MYKYLYCHGYKNIQQEFLNSVVVMQGDLYHLQMMHSLVYKTVVY